MYNVYFFASSWHKSTPDIVSGFDDEFSFKKHTTFIFRFSYNFPLDPGFGRGGGGGGGHKGWEGSLPTGGMGECYKLPHRVWGRTPEALQFWCFGIKNLIAGQVMEFYYNAFITMENGHMIRYIVLKITSFSCIIQDECKLHSYLQTCQLFP